jgi:predicted transcriptional regulator
MVVNERLLHVVASVSQQRGQGEPSDATSAGLSTGDDDADPPSQDELFDVLSNRRRRYAVHALKREHGPVELGDVAEQVAAWEYDVDVEQVSYDERKRVYTALQQSHLPMMDNAGVVEFDKNRGTVEATSALEDVEVYMDVVHGNEIPWSVYYLGLSGVAASLMAAVWAGAWPFSLFPDAAWGVAVVAMFAVSAVAHTYYARGQRIGETEAPPELNT